MARRHPTSVRADIHAIVAALEAGADDYVTGPSRSGRAPLGRARWAGAWARPEGRGTVHVSGHFTVQGADLLRGTVESLHRSGHDRVFLDLQGVQVADDAGLHVLHDLGRELRASGGELLLRPRPA